MILCTYQNAILRSQMFIESKIIKFHRKYVDLPGVGDDFSHSGQIANDSLKKKTTFMGRTKRL